MKQVFIWVTTLTALFAEADNLQKVSIEVEPNSIMIDDVSSNEIRSADLGDALYRNVPSIDLIRRSGIANDILLRGQKRDNINVIIDGAKVCGACVNRMDPPISHILTNNIKDIKISEGPFDVENFGTLSGIIDIETKEPSKKLGGDISLNVGSFGYKKIESTIKGGGDKIKLLLSASSEKSDQYKDGNGDRFYEQLIKATKNNKKMQAYRYQSRYQNLDAFTKSTLLTKAYIDLESAGKLKLSYTANRSDDVLYPSSKMDAIYDDSDIYNLEYIYNNIDLSLYNSKVKHPMSTKYRIAGAKKEKTHYLSTDMKGAKLKGSYRLYGLDLTGGVDMSKRNWDGKFYINGEPMKMKNGSLAPKSLDDVDTTNRAIFLKAKQKIADLSLEYGLRYDDSDVDSSSIKQRDRSYNSLSSNIFATYKIDRTLKLFGGVGNSYRIPDARELYLFMMGKNIGNQNLDQSKNYELDLGFEKLVGNFSIKLKTYYSYIKDYIAFNASKKEQNFENVDVAIYGGELSGVFMNENGFIFDGGLSYKKGRKREPLSGQSGKNLADMRPLKVNLGAEYDFDDESLVRFDFVGSNGWSDVDYENGEQKLSGYGVLNVQAKHRFKKAFDLTLGIDNIFDKTYAITNTYKDLNLITGGSGVDDVMLMNERGRYFYANVKYEF